MEHPFIEYVRTHSSKLFDALLIARKVAQAVGNDDDANLWQHEINALNAVLKDAK